MATAWDATNLVSGDVLPVASVPNGSEEDVTLTQSGASPRRVIAVTPDADVYYRSTSAGANYLMKANVEYLLKFETRNKVVYFVGVASTANLYARILEPIHAPLE